MSARPNKTAAPVPRGQEDAGNSPGGDFDGASGGNGDMRQETALDMWAAAAAAKGANGGSDRLSYRVGSSRIEFRKPVALALAAAAICGGLFLLAALASYKRTAVFHAYPLTPPRITSKGAREFQVALIADLDSASAVANRSNVWRSVYKRGRLTWDPVRESASVEWDSEEDLTGTLSMGGRGMELSELVTFEGWLLTFDDRTGIVYRIHLGGDGEGRPLRLSPWAILSDGDGGRAKGFKCEWATVRGGHLYVGGLGKEWTTPDGKLLNRDPMFVKRLPPGGPGGGGPGGGAVEHLDWHQAYERLRAAAGIRFPGYMIHEAAGWSDVHQQWFFLPRRASKSGYDEREDERRGTNYLLRADPRIEAVEVSRIGPQVDSRGFSSFKFVPGTGDEVVAALKTEELEGKIATYITVFNIDGTVYLPETKVGDLKFEGIEFV